MLKYFCANVISESDLRFFIQHCRGTKLFSDIFICILSFQVAVILMAGQQASWTLWIPETT